MREWLAECVVLLTLNWHFKIKARLYTPRHSVRGYALKGRIGSAVGSDQEAMAQIKKITM